MRSIKTYKTWWEIVGIIAGLFGIVFAINSYIDWRIDQKLSDEQFLRRVGVSARPFCIFNSKASIRFDSGALRFMGFSERNPIEISSIAKDGKVGQITIHFNQLFTYPPSLTVLGAGLYSCRPERGPGFDWTYTIYSADAIVNESSTVEPKTGEQDYKLEILY